MGRERALLDRLAHDGQGNRRPSGEEEAVYALLESVRDNLERLLNSRHEMSEAVSDYGLPAMIDMAIAGGDMVRVVEQAVKVAIDEFEPRLSEVSVRFQHQVFRVEARLVTDSQKPRVQYDVWLRGDGSFEVRG